MIRRLILSLIMLTTFTILSQSQQEDEYAIPEILPPSPTAFELTKYGNIPLDESTGTANVGVDLFDYQVGGFSIPVSINYATTGVKVNQISSWVGMGWNLTAGGAITREVRDLPDELATSRPMPTYTSVYQQYQNAGVSYYNFMLDVENDNNTDYEPDLYNFNVNGYKGSFILDQNLNPVLLNYNKSLTLTRNGSGNFLLKTPEGHSYLFSARETTENENSCTVGSTTFPQVTTWYLSTITTKDGDIISFNYSTHTLYYASGFNQSHYRPINYFDDPNDDCVAPSVVYNNCRLYSYVYAKKLSSITNSKNNVELQFLTSAKADVESGGVKLDNISLYDGTKHIKSYDFRYQTILSNYTTNNSHLSGSTYRYRVFLDSIVELSEGEVQEGRTHSFEYESPQLLPPRFDYAQDILGFNNGQRTNSSLFPEYSVESAPPVSYDASNRDPDFSKSLYGIMKRINFPTGGFSEFVYEPNSVVQTESAYTTSGVNFSVNSFGNVADSRTFTAYANQGIDINVSVDIISGSDYTHDNVIVIIKDLTDNVTLVNEIVNYQGKIYNGFLVEAGHQYQVSLDLSPVKFDEVESTMNFSYISGENTQQVTNNSGIRIQKIISKPNETVAPLVKRYYYNRKENYNQNGPFRKAGSFDHWRILEKRLNCGTDSYDEFQVSSEDWAMDLNYYTRSISFYQFVTTSLGGDLFETGGVEKEFSFYPDDTPFSYGKEVIPNISLSNESQFNGEVLHEEQFKFTNPGFDLVQRTDYYYEFIENNTYDAYVCKNMSPAYTAISDSGLTANQLAIETQDYLLNHYSYLSEVKNLKGITTRSYFGNDIVIDSTYNVYSSSNHNYPTRTEHYINGKTRIQEFIYPDDVISNTSLGYEDLTFSERDAINILKKDNMHDIDQPIQVINKTTYSGNTTSEFVQRKNYKLFSSKAQLNIIATLKDQGDFSSRLEYVSYDSSGNPLEVSKPGGSHTVYIWGYSDQHPIAKIENAMASEVLAQLSGHGNLGDYNETDFLQVNALRSNLPNALVTTYEYEPLVGVTKITDPKGLVTTYHYDNFNRLEFVKDHQGNLLKEHKYNYKN